MCWRCDPIPIRHPGTIVDEIWESLENVSTELLQETVPADNVSTIVNIFAGMLQGLKITNSMIAFSVFIFMSDPSVRCLCQLGILLGGGLEFSL